MKKHAANIITGMRIVGSIALWFLDVSSSAFYIIYLLCGFSDMIDGTIARKTHAVSDLGSKLDTIADFAFVAICSVKLLPLLPLPVWLWIWIAVIALIKISSFIWGLLARGHLVDLHTVFNKATGLLLFLLPFTLRFIEPVYSFAVICGVATIAAIHEGYYIMKENDMSEVDIVDAIDHYDLLIEEENDPFRDPPDLQEYMNKWDGEPLLAALELSTDKSVLEIGVGTGRIAVKVAPLCLGLTGIDISPKTIERARDNLKEYSNISFVCADFNRYEFEETFDVIYSSLTMMHFQDKSAVIFKIDKLLNAGGIFCLSIDKGQEEYIDMGARKIRVYPDTTDNIISIIGETSMTVIKVIETENAYIIVSRKQ